MKRLILFAKGNLDVRDSLHSLRVGEEVVWNGANAIARERFPNVSLRVRHELFTRSDALLAATGTIPRELTERALPLEPYSARAQFSDALFGSDADAFVLSIQPDVMTLLVRRRENGYLLYPHARETWSQADRAWLDAEFVETGPLDVDVSMQNFLTLVERLRRRSAAPILIYNQSAVIPGESMRSFFGMPETLSTRIRRFNLGLIELAQQVDVALVDVDGLVARAGAGRVKLDPVHLNAEGCRVVAEEVIEILDEQGCL